MNAQLKPNDDDSFSLIRGSAPSSPDPTCMHYLLSGPKFDDFEVERDPDTGRDIDLSDFV